MNQVKIKKTRNRRKIKNAEIKINIEKDYKDAIKAYVESNESMNVTKFVTEAILAHLVACTGQTKLD